ncbi:hypothetical protein BGZ80_001120 [Entomortierella chlamydospora]|uniref:Uncharacterized protein n=1 Tax=Entomortierella chlamydospora TaxID=101097 RepID=A0A9P6T406_9FUNG|nr:hypothetical protein BGZ79_009381 [Entomortierella chlamydospora]KAG0022080.1 hypothetical protein BGZ80_001120 [Entomortierella chlamydospora]
MATNARCPSRCVDPTVLKSKTEKTDTSDMTKMTKLTSPDFAWTENPSMSEPLTAAPTSSSKAGSNIEEAISTAMSTIQDSGHHAEIPVDDTVQETSEEIREAVESALALVAKTKVNTVESVKKSAKSISMGTKLEACTTGSSASVRANEYYESSPFRGSSSSSLISSSTTLITRSMTPTKNAGKSNLIPCRRGSLDHGEYFFRNSSGRPVSADKLSEDSDSSDDDYEVSDQESKGRGIFSVVHRILYTTSAIVSNTVRTLTRRGRVKYENNNGGCQDDAMSSSTSTSGDEEVNLMPVYATLISSKPNLTNISAFKPNRKRYHIDKDGFTVVEDPHLRGDRRTYTSITAAPQVSPSAETLHRTRYGGSQTHTAGLFPSNQTTTKKDRPVTVSHLVTSDLSYSRAITMNLAESDHGVRVGMTKSYENDSTSSEDSSLDDQGPALNDNVPARSTINVNKRYHRQSVNY